MYEQVFNLTSRPFTSTPYVKHYFAASAIEQALQQCKLIIDRGSGPVVLVGDHGTGKTLLLAILEECFQSRFRVVNMSVSGVQGRADLLQNILFALKLNYRGQDASEMRLAVVEYLKRDDASDEGVLLLVDDAQKLTRETIEELQLLTSFVRDGQPLVRMVLAGSQGIEDRLADSSLESFNQRIAGRCFLSCLSGDEVESYVREHIERAGGDPDALFTPDVYRAVREVSGGRPRYINQVCDHAMIFSATRGQTPVTDSLIREAWYDIQQLPGSVAPASSEEATVDSNSSQPQMIEDSEGWTVLEFGELAESDLSAFEDNAEAPPEVEQVERFITSDIEPESEAESQQEERELVTEEATPDISSSPATSFSTLLTDDDVTESQAEKYGRRPREIKLDSSAN